jgi:hypothetical protein
MRNLFILLSAFFTLPFTSTAQPFALATNNIDGAPFTCTLLEDLGVYKRLRVQATQNATDATWEFPQTCAFPGDVWRPYTAGTAPVPFNTTIPPVPGTNAALYNSGNGGASGNLAPVTLGNYYTFNIQNISAPASPHFSVLETPYLPLYLPSATVTQSPTADGVLFSTPVTVSVQLPGTPTEHIYIRYTTNAFVSSTIVEANVSGTVASAVIPGQPGGTTVTYYVYSSPKTKTEIDAEVVLYGEIVHDMSTLEFNTNNAANYSYTVAANNVFVTATGNPAFDAYYPTVKEAFDAINAGTHIGAITVRIIGSTTEAATATLNESGSGSANYTTVLVIPAGGTAKNINGNINGPLIELNGADAITINGLNTGGNALTLSNESIAAGTNISTIYLHAGANNNSILNTTILGAGSNAAAGTVLFTNTGSAIANTGNLIGRSTIAAAATGNPVNSIFAEGNAANSITDNTISGNNIADFFNADLPTAGILLANGNNNWTISGNKIFQTSARSYSTGNTHYGIKIAAGNQHNILSNTIGYANTAGSGIYAMEGMSTRFVGIETATTTGGTVSIQGNKISGIELLTASDADTLNGVLCGINIISGNANIGTTDGNIVGDDGAAIDVLKSTTLVPGSLTTGIHCSSTGTINMDNNVIGGITATAIDGTISTSLVAVYITGNAAALNMNNNIIGNKTNYNLRSGEQGSTSASTQASGIYVAGRPAVSNINQNTIQNIASFGSGTSGYARGFWTFNSITTTVRFNLTRNVINNITSNSGVTDVLNGRASAVGINIAGGSGNTIERNRITNIENINTGSNASYVVGISSANSLNTSIAYNYVSSITNAGTSTTLTAPSAAVGILIRSANTAIKVYNNMVTLGDGQNTNTAFVGINANHGTNPFGTIPTDAIYYNSVSITGAATGNQPSFGFLRGDFSNIERTENVDLKNNIFSNTRTNGNHYAIADNINATATGTGWMANYNNLYTGTAAIGWFNGSHDFAGWQTSTSGDGNSISDDALFLLPASDLHIPANSPVLAKGIDIAGYIDDYDGFSRNNPPAIGCIEKPFALPVKVEYLRGLKQGNTHLLQWKVNCTNTPYVTLTLERSSNGRNFSSLYTTQASAVRCEQPFDYTENNLLAGTNYYRLKMKDADGIVTYSMVVSLLNKQTGFELVKIAPVPVERGNAVVEITSAQKTGAQLIVTDMTGRKMQTATVQLIAGSNLINIDMTTLAPGVYQLSCISANQLKTLRFVKR